MSENTDAVGVREPRDSTTPPWQRRVASAVVAIISRFLGLGMVFTGGASVIMGSGVDGTFGMANWLEVSAGLLLIAGSAATMVVSTAGTLIAASLELALALIGFVVPYVAGGWESHPISWMPRVYAWVFPDALAQASYAAATGFLLTFAAVSLAAALGQRARRRAGPRVSPIGRIIAMGAAVILSVPGAVLVWIGGYGLNVEYRVLASSGIPVGSLIALLVGALLCAAVSATARLSAAGLYGFGLYWVVMWVALAGFLAGVPSTTTSILPNWATQTAVVWCLSGFAAALAVFLLATGVVARVLGRSAMQRRRAQNAL
ncbi:hypothetical protein ACSAGD_04250 [Paramicrobacterium sp. CJ85]|uniref:hypothetical protein n=1 Tax=Paramicrobacterium sp. CJ85 TaxID=3445355 RepID=UPI003F602FBE